MYLVFYSQFYLTSLWAVSIPILKTAVRTEQPSARGPTQADRKLSELLRLIPLLLLGSLITIR